MHRMHYIADESVDPLDGVRPATGRTGERHALVELAFLADELRDARDLCNFRLLELDDVVERLGDLAVDAGQIERHARGKIAALELAERFKKLPPVEHHLQACVDRFHGTPLRVVLVCLTLGCYGANTTGGIGERHRPPVAICTTSFFNLRGDARSRHA